MDLSGPSIDVKLKERKKDEIGPPLNYHLTAGHYFW
jgi:hypothetical protein